MKAKGTIIAKGIYKHPQPDGFVSVKQYIFVHKDGKKYLLIRCANEMDTSIDSITLILTQINSDGEIVSTEKLTRKLRKVSAGTVFTFEEGIPVSEECTDFKLKIAEARFDVYTYRQRGRRVCAYYTPPANERKSPPIGTPLISVKKSKKPKSPMCVILPIILAILLIGASIYTSYVEYEKEYERETRKNREEPRSESPYGEWDR